MTRGFFMDLVLMALGAWAGLTVAGAFSGDPRTFDAIFPQVVLFSLCASLVLLVNGTNRSVWRWTTGDDVLRIMRGAVAASVVYGAAAMLLFRLPVDALGPSLSAVAAAGMMISGRGIARVMDGGGIRALLRVVAKDAPATILVGATATVTRAIHAARTHGPLHLKPIAIVSTRGNQIGRVFAGARVHDGRVDLEGKLEELTRAALQRNPEVRIALIGADPGRKVVRAALNVVARYPAKLLRMPEMPGLPMAPVEPADVLGRAPRELDLSGPRKLLHNKRVLVTGAGGTIGSELVRQIATFEPGRLVLLDLSESNLHAIALDLAERVPGLQVETRLADIRDEFRMQELFASLKPQVIIHAAANKHVPLMERHPCEAIRVNLGGTRTLANAALRHGCEAFVLISTDKAVNPANVMGAAKRAAELYVRACSEEAGGHFLSVRFGNVLGSTGSIMPLFERQIEQGGPVTVTDPNMTRWFMTVEEAGALVLQAAALGAGITGSGAPGGDRAQDSASNQPPGSLYVLDMGEPMRIVDLAEGMIRMKGKEPGRDIEIRIIGPRPGEKRSEQLFYPFETRTPAPIEGVYAVSDETPLSTRMHEQVKQVIDAADRDQTGPALEQLAALVPQFHSPLIGR